MRKQDQIRQALGSAQPCVLVPERYILGNYEVSADRPGLYMHILYTETIIKNKQLKSTYVYID
jgi:hypothetical protein